jgi:hypothetical protein
MLGTAPSTVLDREEFREFPLIGKLKLSSNTSRYVSGGVQVEYAWCFSD